MHPFLKRNDIPAALGLLFTIGIFFSPLIELYNINSNTPDIIVFGLSTISDSLPIQHIYQHQNIQLAMLVVLMCAWMGIFFLEEEKQANAYILISLILTTFPLWLMSFVEGTVKPTVGPSLISHFSPGFIFIALSLVTSTFALLELPSNYGKKLKAYKEIKILDQSNFED